MDTRRASELGDADNRSLDVLASHHHEIGELVDDDDEIRHLGRRIVVMLEYSRRLLLIERRDLADPQALKHLEAPLHFGHRPLQGARRLLGLRHDGNIQVRQPIVAG